MSRNTLATGGAAAVAVILVIAGMTLCNAWIIMLLVGGLHSAATSEIPAIGFGTALLVAISLSVIGSFFKSSSR